ncbi:MAG: type II secretion system F family protein [Agathobacter sp.]|nr:type II secretion system F family protein [Agathobacter sp.]
MLSRKNHGYKVVILLIGILILAAIMDLSQIKLEENQLPREEVNGESVEWDLYYRLEDEDKKEYQAIVEAQKPTKEQVDDWFVKAKEEIDEVFQTESNNEHIFSKTYVNGIVQAEWSFNNYDWISPDGETNEEDLNPGSCVVVTATVKLSCHGYEEEYIFPITIEGRELSDEEEIEKEIEAYINNQMNETGEEVISLPTEINGKTITWGLKKNYLFIKVLFFEVIVCVLMVFVIRERRQQEIETRKTQIMLDYAEIVNKVLILLGSGMSIKQVWDSISTRYLDKRNKKLVKVRPAYEEMVRTNYEIMDGESERVAFQNFGERIQIHSYHRFARILVQNMQKGTSGLCEILEQEAIDAFEERKALVKKQGEEAGTRMLFPLVLMMGLVMAIIVAPAIVEFIG